MHAYEISPDISAPNKSRSIPPTQGIDVSSHVKLFPVTENACPYRGHPFIAEATNACCNGLIQTLTALARGPISNLHGKINCICGQPNAYFYIVYRLY